MTTKAAQFFDWLNEVTAKADESPAGKILTDKFFQVYHSGGGCLAWNKESEDSAYYALITHGDNELGDDVAEPETAKWSVGIYSSDGERYSDSFEVDGLAAAIAWCNAALMDPERLLA